MLYPSSNTTSTHAHISIHTMKSVVNMNGRNLLLNKKFNDSKLTKRNIVSAIWHHLFMVTWCKLLTPYVTQRYDNCWRHIPNDTQSFGVAELPTMRRCLWLSVWPSYLHLLVGINSRYLVYSLYLSYINFIFCSVCCYPLVTCLSLFCTEERWFGIFQHIGTDLPVYTVS